MGLQQYLRALGRVLASPTSLFVFGAILLEDR